MKQYLDLLSRILDEGDESMDRTGTGTRSLFAQSIRMDLADGFPLLTTKRVFWKGVVEELLWFLRGETNVRSLQARGVTIWDEWADADGELGPVYGAQWRNWSHIKFVDPNGHPSYDHSRIDQIAKVISDIKSNPYSRRHLVSAWNVGEVEDMKLPPCHYAFQFYVRNGRLSCHVHLRSCDVFLGLPFNIASYALLTEMVASVCDLAPGELVVDMTDCHIYLNHIDQVETQLERTPAHLPRLFIDPFASALGIDSIQAAHIKLVGYEPAPAISAPVAV